MLRCRLSRGIHISFMDACFAFKMSWIDWIILLVVRWLQIDWSIERLSEQIMNFSVWFDANFVAFKMAIAKLKFDLLGVKPDERKRSVCLRFLISSNFQISSEFYGLCLYLSLTTLYITHWYENLVNLHEDKFHFNLLQTKFHCNFWNFFYASVWKCHCGPQYFLCGPNQKKVGRPWFRPSLKSCSHKNCGTSFR